MSDDIITEEMMRGFVETSDELIDANNYADLKARVDALTRRVEALEGKAQDGKGEGWRKWEEDMGKIVWCWGVNGKGAEKCHKYYLEPGDLWQPYDPERPEPPAPPKSEVE